MFLLSWFDCCNEPFSEFDFLTFLSCRSWLFISFFNPLVIHLYGFPLMFFCIVGAWLSKTFGYFCVEIFKHFIDIRCLFNQFPVDVFLYHSTGQHGYNVYIHDIRLFLDHIWWCWFFHVTNHVMITEGQRERCIHNISHFACKYQVDWSRWIFSYSCCSLDNLQHLDLLHLISSWYQNNL